MMDPLIQSPELPSSKFREVREHDDFREAAEKLLLKEAERRTLGLICLKLSYCAGSWSNAIDDVREYSIRDRTLVRDGVEFAPLSVRYEISPDDEEVWIVGVQPLKGGDVRVSDDTSIEVFIAVLDAMAYWRNR